MFTREADWSPEHYKGLVTDAYQLSDCDNCEESLMQPIDWDEAGPRHWKICLGCPGCGEKISVIAHDETVDYYDVLLEKQAASLARCANALREEWIDDEVEALHHALESGLILPEDF